MRKLILVVLAFGALTACGAEANQPADPGPQAQATTAEPTTTTPPAEPMTEDAARAAAKEQLDAYAAEDYVGAWDMWTAAGQAAISREEYVRLHELCPQTAAGVAFEVQSVRLEGDGTSATVRIGRMGAVATFKMHYEQGQWRWQPADDAIAGYAKGVDAVVAERKADGLCG